jgi:hypothetical protein
MLPESDVAMSGIMEVSSIRILQRDSMSEPEGCWLITAHEIRSKLSDLVRRKRMKRMSGKTEVESKDIVWRELGLQEMVTRKEVREHGK